ncbi:unnamed protein product [Closterium sp. NIES-53]
MARRLRLHAMAQRLQRHGGCGDIQRHNGCNGTAAGTYNGTEAAAARNGMVATAARNGTAASTTSNSMTKVDANVASRKPVVNKGAANLKIAMSSGVFGMDLEKGGEDIPCTSCHEA